MVLADGTERRADIVISAADGHATLDRMLGGKYTTGRIAELLRFLRALPAAPLRPWG